MLLTGKLQKWGNSYGIRISKKVAKRLGMREDELLIIDLERQGRGSGFGMCKGAPPFKRDPNDDRGW